MSVDPQCHVAVIGGGVVGVCTMLAVLEHGHRVTLIEPASPGGTQGASFGNGAVLSPASIVPMSVPGLWKQVPGYLFDPQGPLTIRWRHLPRLAPWLLRFLAAGSTVAKVERTARVLAALLADAPAQHAAIAERAGLASLIRQDGMLFAYPDRAAFQADMLADACAGTSLRASGPKVWRRWRATVCRWKASAAIMSRS